MSIISLCILSVVVMAAIAAVAVNVQDFTFTVAANLAAQNRARLAIVRKVKRDRISAVKYSSVLWWNNSDRAYPRKDNGIAYATRLLHTLLQMQSPYRNNGWRRLRAA